MLFDPHERRSQLKQLIRQESASVSDKCCEEPTVVYRGDCGSDTEGYCFSDEVQRSQKKLFSRERIAEAERAIEKLEEGTYGYCDECEEEIPKARMNACIHATHCINCKGEREKATKQKAVTSRSSGCKGFLAYA